MFLGFLSPLLKEAGLIDPDYASDPMNTVIGLTDAHAKFSLFMEAGAEAVGGVGEGANLAALQPTPAPTAPTPTASIAPIVHEMGMNMNGPT